MVREEEGRGRDAKVFEDKNGTPRAPIDGPRTLASMRRCTRQGSTQYVPERGREGTGRGEKDVQGRREKEFQLSYLIFPN